MTSRQTHFDVDRKALESISSELDQFRNISDKHDRIVTMAAWILFRIAKARPFFNGNKRSATVACVRFLNANGYDLLIELLDIRRETHKLLTGVQSGIEEFKDVKTYLKHKTVTFRSR